MPKRAAIEMERELRHKRYEGMFLRKHGFNGGECMRQPDVHRNTWRRISYFVAKGYVTVEKEYGIPTARITEKGMCIAQGKKPGPRPSRPGFEPATRYVFRFEVNPLAHWTVKLMVVLIQREQWSLRQLGIRSGISPATMQNWLLGIHPNIFRIEAVLGCFGLNLGQAWVEWEKHNATASEAA